MSEDVRAAGRRYNEKGISSLARFHLISYAAGMIARLFNFASQPGIGYCRTLFGLLIAMQLVLAVFSNPTVFVIMNTIILISVFFTISQNRRQRIVGLTVIIPLLALLWTGIYSRLDTVFMISLFMGLHMAFLLFVIHLLTLHVFNATELRSDHLFAAFCIYLLAGVAFADLYSLIILLDHDAFKDVIDPTDPQTLTDAYRVLTYFSFTTLTTLGYGDISPTTPIAQTVSNLQAIFGVLFSASLVARLAGAVTLRTS